MAMLNNQMVHHILMKQKNPMIHVHIIYPLVNVYITMENHHFCKSAINGPFSTAMLNYQRAVV